MPPRAPRPRRPGNGSGPPGRGNMRRPDVATGFSGATAVHISIFGLTPVVKFGSEEMRKKYLPQVVSGDLHVCFGVTEADATKIA